MRRLHRCLPSVLPLVLLMPAGPLHGQNVGQRVRVTVGNDIYVGEVIAVDGRSFELFGHGRVVTFTEASHIDRIERSIMRSQWKRGLKWGAITGASGGVLYGVLFGTGCELLTASTATDTCTRFGLGMALFAGAAWGAAGGVIGMGVGALLKEEAWTPIPLGDRRVEYAPTFQPLVGPNDHPGLSLGVRIRLR